MRLHPKVSLRAQPHRASLVPEQALHQGLLRLHHPLPSKNDSPWAGECFEGEHRELCAALQKMFAYLEGSAVGQELEDKIKFYKSTSFTSHRRVGVNDYS